MNEDRFDAIVVGAGVGGMCTAALLAKRGLKVVVIERRPSLGGRFSTIRRGGYRCAVGGLAVPVGLSMEQVCDEIGIPSGVKPSTSTALWLDGTLYDVQKGGTRRIIRESAPAGEGERVIEALNRAMLEELPSNEITFRDWLNQYTRNPHIHGIFQATISSLLTVNSSELPAGEYFRVIKTISPLRFGFIAGGSITLWERMKDFIEAAGGRVVTSASVRKIKSEKGQVTGVIYRKDGREFNLSAQLVVSNLGPLETVNKVGRENIDAAYTAEIEQKTAPTAIIWMHFASEEQLFDYSAISFACTRRVNMIDCPSMEAPDCAPQGRHLYTLGAAPANTLQVDNLQDEFEEVKRDLERIIPDFDRRCTVLSQTCYRNHWPGFRTVPGRNVGHMTPVSGLYNVGDASCPSGYAGSMGAARSAQLVCDHIVSG